MTPDHLTNTPSLTLILNLLEPSSSMVEKTAGKTRLYTYFPSKPCFFEELRWTQIPSRSSFDPEPGCDRATQLFLIERLMQEIYNSAQHQNIASKLPWFDDTRVRQGQARRPGTYWYIYTTLAPGKLHPQATQQHQVDCYKGSEVLKTHHFQGAWIEEALAFVRSKQDKFVFWWYSSLSRRTILSSNAWLQWVGIWC